MAANNSPVIVVEINAAAEKLTIMNAPGASVQKARAKDFPLPGDKLRRGQYAEALDEALPAVSPLFRQLRMFALTVVLPASLVTFDIITIPTMSKSQMESAFKAELKNQYKNAEELKISPQIFYTNKKSTAYLLTVTRKALIDGIRETFAKHSMPVTTLTFAPAAAAGALFELRPKVKKDNLLFVDIKENSTLLILTEKDRILGFSELPFGQDILKPNKVVGENTIYGDDVAELAVLNAKEAARAKQLTKSIITISDEEYSDEEDEETGVRPAPDAPAAEETAEIPAATGEIPAMNMENLSEEEMLKLIGELQAEDAAGTAPVRSEKTLTKKEGRKLPKFMQREFPEDERGFVYENFRYILKRILLFIRQCRLTEGMPTPDYTVLNLPAQFAFLLERLNAEEDSHMKFLYFDPSVEKNPELTGNLSAYGGYFAGSFKGQQIL